MITKNNLIEYILKESNGFKNYLELSEPDWKEEGDYTVLAEYSRYILKLYKEKEEINLRENFSLIDDIFVKGDRYVKEAITIGLLETLQNNISWEEGIKEEDFLPFLSDTLKIEWKNVSDFWEGKKGTV